MNARDANAILESIKQRRWDIKEENQALKELKHIPEPQSFTHIVLPRPVRIDVRNQGIHGHVNITHVMGEEVYSGEIRSNMPQWMRPYLMSDAKRWFFDAFSFKTESDVFYSGKRELFRFGTARNNFLHRRQRTFSFGTLMYSTYDAHHKQPIFLGLTPALTKNWEELNANVHERGMLEAIGSTAVYVLKGFSEDI